MPASGLHKDPGVESLSLEQLAENVGWLMQHAPVERVKLTGGKPLMRPGLEALISMLARIAGVREISMTTNGSLLPRRAAALKAAGLARVNVSLDSLDPERFGELSRGARLERTREGVDAAIAAGLVPLKLNAVLQRSTWRDDVPPLLDFAAARNLEIRFIELMRTGTERAWCDSEYVSVEEVKGWLAPQTSAVAIAAPATLPTRYTAMLWKGSLLKVGWIAPRSRPFCASCERLRMDSRGRVRRCLMNSETLDLAVLRRMQGHQAAAEAFHAYMADKHVPIDVQDFHA
jgi:cyclic pyranopterin phosphate synthase